MATHYQTIIMPARVRSPRDKASVESSVNIVTTWIIQALRNTTCFSLEELNKEIWNKSEALNHRPFQNRSGSRWSAFLEEEKFALSPLPNSPYMLSVWLKAKVRPVYHITINCMFYSVTHELIVIDVEITFTYHIIVMYQILFNILKYQMSDNHLLYNEQTPEEAIKWSSELGPSVLEVVTFLLDQYEVEKQALNAIFTLKKLERKFSSYEIEQACKLVLQATN